jgi:hypothetical protein
MLGLMAGAAVLAQAPTFGPGSRVLLDAHNAYPYEGKYADRMPRALATGLPVAIEQDLIWRPGPGGQGGESVVGHDVDKVADAPSFEDYFFTQLEPVMARALKEDRRDTWPLVVLNLDFKTNEPEHHRRVLDDGRRPGAAHGGSDAGADGRRPDTAADLPRRGAARRQGAPLRRDPGAAARG